MNKIIKSNLKVDIEFNATVLGAILTCASVIHFNKTPSLQKKNEKKKHNGRKGIVIAFFDIIQFNTGIVFGGVTFSYIILSCKIETLQNTCINFAQSIFFGISPVVKQYPPFQSPITCLGVV